MSDKPVVRYYRVHGGLWHIRVNDGEPIALSARPQTEDQAERIARQIGGVLIEGEHTTTKYCTDCGCFMREAERSELEYGLYSGAFVCDNCRYSTDCPPDKADES